MNETKEKSLNNRVPANLCIGRWRTRAPLQQNTMILKQKTTKIMTER